jgi:hypothetical protein
MARTYPYAAWVLKPSFRPAQVTLVREYDSCQYANTWDVAESGKLYALSELFPTKESAIVAGWERVHDQEAKLTKQLESLQKKREQLTKAAKD